MRKETWDALSAGQKKVVQDAHRRDRAEQRARLADEKQVADRLKTQGLTVTAVDMKPFHDNADKVYGASDFAQGLEQGSAGADCGNQVSGNRR